MANDIIDVVISDNSDNVTINTVINSDVIDLIVTDNRDNILINATPNLFTINVSNTSGNIIGSNYYLASTLNALPAVGDPTILYVVNDTNKIYRSSNSLYTEISASASTTWGNIGGTLSSQTDLQNALNAKAPLASPTFTGTVNGITKAMVGLGNLDNTTDLLKPISTATQTALNLKYDASNPSGYISGITSGNVTTALGYTPYNATNPSNFISSITSGNVTTALGFTPSNDSLVVHLAGIETITGQKTFSPTVTAASAIARGTNLTPTLVAAANSDTLVGLDINPTFTNGSFTGVTNYGLRVTGDTSVSKMSVGGGAINQYGVLDINGSSSSGANKGITFSIGGSPLALFGVPGANSQYANGSIANTDFVLRTIPSSGRLLYAIGASGNVAMAILPTSNILIGTTTDAGFRLDVNGTTRIGTSLNIGGTTTDASAILQADSTTKGILFPRMTTTQKNAISSPATGLVVYDTTLNKLCVRAASAWETLTSL